MNELPGVLMALIGHVPVMLVWLTGLVLAMVNWQRLRFVAMLVLCGSVVILGAELLFTPISMMLPMWTRQYGWTTVEMGRLMSVVAMLSSLVHAAGYALIVAAVFARRGDPSVAPRPQQ